MALYDSADLLARCKRLARRPPTDQAMPDSNWYAFLTEAKSETYPDLFSRYPWLGYGAPVLMTTADGGATYTFGLDADGDPIVPGGHAEIYPNLRAIPYSPLVNGEDFMMERNGIRMPGGRTRSFSSGPYARFAARADEPIDETHAPDLFPKEARMLLVYKALEQWASRPGSGAKPEYYRDKYDRLLNKTFLDLSTFYNRQGGSFEGVASLLYIGDFGQMGLNT